jgi:class 3 adenylate cyclase
MKATNTSYSLNDSIQRIDEILNTDSKCYEESKSIPSRDRLTYTNGFYVNCTAIFVDICDSSGLTNVHERPVLAKIYRSFISEMVAMFNSFDQCREISINGDCVWCVFDTPYKSDVDDAFNAACTANALINILNFKLEKKGYQTYDANIGMDYGRALMHKAGYKGSQINDVIWMGDVVNSACHLCNEDRGIFGKRIFLSETIYNNLNDDNKGFCNKFDDSIFHSSAVNAEMDDWLESQNNRGK